MHKESVADHVYICYKSGILYQVGRNLRNVPPHPTRVIPRSTHHSRSLFNPNEPRDRFSGQARFSTAVGVLALKENEANRSIDNEPLDLRFTLSFSIMPKVRRLEHVRHAIPRMLEESGASESAEQCSDCLLLIFGRHRFFCLMSQGVECYIWPGVSGARTLRRQMTQKGFHTVIRAVEHEPSAALLLRRMAGADIVVSNGRVPQNVSIRNTEKLTQREKLIQRDGYKIINDVSSGKADYAVSCPDGWQISQDSKTCLAPAAYSGPCGAATTSMSLGSKEVPRLSPLFLFHLRRPEEAIASFDADLKRMFESKCEAKFPCMKTGLEVRGLLAGPCGLFACQVSLCRLAYAIMA
eukprot:284817009_4